MRFTLFPDAYATSKIDRDAPWPDICAMIENAPEFAAKAACSWIKLGVFGNQPTDTGCLRHDLNLESVTGCEGDYDQERISIDEAADMARAAGLTCILYTSASHRPNAPRWRVLAPLAREYPREARAAFIARMNGVFGGIFSAESFTASQAFLWGRVAGAEYRVIRCS